MIDLLFTAEAPAGGEGLGARDMTAARQRGSRGKRATVNYVVLLSANSPRDRTRSQS